jgi:hypothetical protein
MNVPTEGKRKIYNDVYFGCLNKKGIHSFYRDDIGFYSKNDHGNED